MKIKQQNQIKKFLIKEFETEQGNIIFDKQEKILNDIIKNINGKSKNQRKVLTQTILPRIALYEAMLKSGLSAEETYKYMKKYFQTLENKEKGQNFF